MFIVPVQVGTNTNGSQGNYGADSTSAAIKPMEQW